VGGGWGAHTATPGAAATADKPARTLLGKHLDHFSARNTFDYFIHKDLGGFLRRELDFYLKNEVVRLDDLESLPPDHLQRVQGKVKAIRAVAQSIIRFLAAVEDFQKKMWLKKKFVLNTNWLVTVDRIPPALRDVVASNAEQWAEWERLGFKPENTGDAGLFGGAAWGTRAYLDVCDKLVVDTRLFDHDFVTYLLASDELRGTASTLNEAIRGTIISSENFQGLRLLSAVTQSAIDCVYIDPPYNTDASPIVYKNGYRRSTWAALLADRTAADAPLRKSDALRCIAIDDFEYPNLQGILDRCGRDIHHATAAVRSKPQGRPTATGFSANHEYAVFWGPVAASIGRLPRSGSKADRYPHVDDKGIYSWANFRKSGTDSDRSDRRKSFYPVYVGTQGVRVPQMSWDEDAAQWVGFDPPASDETAVWPIDLDNNEKVWTCSVDRARDELADIRVSRDADGKIELQKKYRPNQDGALPGTWWEDSAYSASESGTKILKDLFGAGDFDYPKSLFLVADCLRVGNVTRNATVLDYFAGSGTTAHAVLHLNREDKGDRRFALIEMGAYFNTVIRPRLAKVVYSPTWRDGRAQLHDKGVSAVIKGFALESYEDALNNLPAPSGTLLDGRTDAEKDALIAYGLDLELGPHLLNLDAFRDPWGYTINAQLAGDAEIKRHRVDLVETFNYLIGLKVHAYGPLERYTADFERAAHADGLGRIKLTGRLRRDANGPYVFQRVEGELNDGNSTRVLVVWRKLSDDPEEDAAVLDAWMARHRESTRERTEHRDYHLIYINGPVTLPQPTAEIRTVYPTEETFKIKMFEDTDSASQVGGGHG
jgi:adenine-specific DNA-methyltransferase